MNGHSTSNRASSGDGSTARNDGNPEAEKLSEYALIDILRFVLASTVIVGHMKVLGWDPIANLAVQIFFALSGWLIGGILYDTAKGELCRFYYNRATRVWIPYFITVFALYATSFLHEAQLSSRWLEFLAYDVTFTHNWFSLRPNADIALAQMPLHGTNNHLWSLAVEEQFYLLAPLLMTLTRFGRSLLPWLLLALLSITLASEYSSICFGVIAAVSSKKVASWHLAPWSRTLLALSAVTAAFVMAHPSLYAVSAPFFAVCIVLLCATPFPRTRLTRWLGGISFPTYLNSWVGMFILHAIEKHFGLPVGWYSLPLEFLASVAAGAVSYTLIDSQVMRRRNWYFSAGLGWTLGAVGYVLVIGGVVFYYFGRAGIR